MLGPGTSLSAAADALQGAPGGELPVADGEGPLLGVLAAEALAERMGEEPDETDPAQWADVRPTVPPEASVADALELLEHHSVRALPVVEDGRLVGWFTAAAVLTRIRREDGAG